MAIHYSLERAASCRSMGRISPGVKRWVLFFFFFAHARPADRAGEIYWRAVSRWPCRSTDWPVAAIFGSGEAGLLVKGGSMIADADTF